ncbi:EFR1 family ferrodoxin [Salidesulfovibrio onnuriiensis]|uniref:EFR1 family ferrodoxin n=1 Tax=Salidesulfovibrio onnuriiensis TaxID=2583823 RepID=UPI0011C8DB6B|nr:EFR1 family ferrodoxin [Salidesulfovibrio onnuriiensis]
MQIESLKLVCFSPTGTTKAVVQGIADGFGSSSVELVDITGTEARKQPLRTSESDLLVVGIPVYMGRLPELATQWLNTIQARNTPAVCVVVYGNRAYENSLLELKDVLKNCGCVPVAGAAYIGEHSFSDAGMPTAQGRPDADDLGHAQSFGRKVRDKMMSLAELSEAAEAEVPGSFPYEGRTQIWDVDFIAVSDACVQCGLCAEVCPVDAVDPQDSAVIDIEKCITCCACIKNCPQSARTMKDGPVRDAQKRLHDNCREPRQPENYL